MSQTPGVVISERFVCIRLHEKSLLNEFVIDKILWQ